MEFESVPALSQPRKRMDTGETGPPKGVRYKSSAAPAELSVQLMVGRVRPATEERADSSSLRSSE
jgi:hypothetical protein